MDNQILEKLGLTKGEIKVYLALNKLGESTIGPIGSESGVSKSKLYDILDRLKDKGLVGYISRDNVKHFVANDPHMILEYISRKEDELKYTKNQVEEILPKLMLERSMNSEKRIAEIYEGYQGIKAIREELTFSLKSNEELLVLGAPKIANIKWDSWFLNFHKRRIQSKIFMRIIYNSDAKEYGKVRKEMKYTEVKYLPNNLVSPNWIDIFPDAVLFVMVLQTPVAFVVRDKELAKSFKGYFDIMWKNSLVDLK